MTSKNKNKNKDYTIYALLHKPSESFFIDFGTTENLADTYRKHFTETVLKTKNWISELKLMNEKPCIILLENLFSNRYECYKLVLIWTKIFLENNFSSIANDTFIEEAQTIYEENLELYENRKLISISEIIDCKNCVLPNYSYIKCSEYTENGIEKLKRKPSSKKRIEIRVDEDEEELIKERAEEVGMDVAAFIKASACECEIRIIDYSYINELNMKVSSYEKTLNRYLLTLLSQTDYWPEDLKDIQNSIDEMSQSFNMMKKTIRKNTQKILTSNKIKNRKENDL